MNRAELAAAPNHFGYLLLSLGRVLREQTRDALQPLGLDPNHIGVLSVLKGSGSLSQRELGRVLRTDRTTIVRLIDELQSLGLVAREASEDRRVNALRLTAAGESMAKQMERFVAEAERRVFAALTAPERSALRLTLSRVLESLPPFET